MLWRYLLGLGSNLNYSFSTFFIYKENISPTWQQTPTCWSKHWTGSVSSMVLNVAVFVRKMVLGPSPTLSVLLRRTFATWQRALRNARTETDVSFLECDASSGSLALCNGCRILSMLPSANQRRLRRCKCVQGCFDHGHRPS